MDTSMDEAKDYYAVLGLSKTCTLAEIKKAYRKKALCLHPDHNKDPRATEQFQHLAKIHSILSDPKKRAFYDKHGDVEEMTDSEMDAYEYWRSIFPPITEQNIEDFRKKYVGSADEIQDLLAYFQHYQGDMRCIMECVPLADAANFDRLVAVLEKEVPASDPHRAAWVKSRKGLKKKLEKEEASEASEAEELKKELKVGKGFDAPAGEDGIPPGVAAMILARQKEQGKFLDQLAAKYAPPPKKAATKRKK